MAVKKYDTEQELEQAIMKIAGVPLSPENICEPFRTYMSKIANVLSNEKVKEYEQGMPLEVFTAAIYRAGIDAGARIARFTDIKIFKDEREA